LNNLFSASSTVLGWKRSSRLNNAQIPTSVLAWLVDPASLTQRVIVACNGTFTVDVISEHRGSPNLDECQALNIQPGKIARIREVRLLCNDTAWVYARTIIPDSSLTGPLRRLRLLGNKPLGAVLFADKTMRRGPLEIAALTPHHPLYRHALPSIPSRPKSIWGRRSVFYLSNKPLLVSEFFLPDIPAHP
jgi:chorismate--pyruvate lyase